MSQQQKLTIAGALILLAVLGRLLPHLWNFTPVIAVSIIAGRYLGRNYGIAVPLIAMVASDLFIGFYHWPLMATVYGSIALAGLLSFAVRKYPAMETGVVLSLISSTLFFLITNGAVWYFTDLYPGDLSGLLSSYTAGLPFYRNALMGDLFYTGGLLVIFQTVPVYLPIIQNTLIHKQKPQKC